MPAFLSFSVIVLLSTGAGYSVARWVPWRSAMHTHCLVWPLAMVLAPFLFGLSVILVLLCVDGTSPQTHVLLAGAILLCVNILGIFCKVSDGLTPFNGTRENQWQQATGNRQQATGNRQQATGNRQQATGNRQQATGNRILVALLCTGVIEMLVFSWRFPLVQNDPLEYALVAKEIYAARSLSVYPLLDSQASISGFFGPWTHPPLYPALIYAVYALQNTADMAGWMKAIAPWFMLSALVGVIGLGRLQSARTGWLAGVLFLFIPLLTEGAQGSAIDALPVSGMVLLMLGIVGIKREHPYAGMYLGLMLGIALWAHSQAILYLPIAVVVWAITEGWAHWRRALRTLVLACVMVILVAGYPYVRNLAIYGAFVSDMPAVFALDHLAWREFFKYTRAIYDGMTQLSFGLFKGLTGIPSYGMVFWLAMFAAIYILRSGNLRQYWQNRKYMHVMQTADGTMLVSVLMLAIYHGGMLLSILVGTDLMIKNDRYYLVIAPAAVLLAAYGLARCMRRESRRYRTIALALLACHVLLYPVNSNFSARLYPQTLISEDPLNARPWDSLGNIRVVQTLHVFVPPHARVLALRPADMYYAQRKMVSYLDPSMLPLYALHDAQQLHSALLDAGITYVNVPDYFIPPVNHTALMSLLGNPELADLVHDVVGNQLYALKTMLSSQALRIDVTMNLAEQPWMDYPARRTSNLMPFFKNDISAVVLPGVFSSDRCVFLKNCNRMLMTEIRGLSDEFSQHTFTAEEIEPIEYRIDATMEGEGYFQVWVWGNDASGAYFSKRIGDFVLSRKIPDIHFQRRVVIPNDVGHVNIGVKRFSGSRLMIKSIHLNYIKYRNDAIND